MNKLSLVGNVVRDIELKQSQGGKSVAKFTVAAQRKYKNSEGKYDSDFIPCVAFDKQAEFVSKYFKKGDKIGIIGHMQSGSYDGKNGKVYTLDCYVDDAEFVGGSSKKENTSAAPKQQDEFMSIPDDMEDSLPFN